MSLSQPKLTNPAKLFIQWAGDVQVNSWYYYDKDTKKKVFFGDKSVRIIILDQLSTVTGYSEKDGVGIYANEVKYAAETLNVRTFKGTEIAKGTWKEIKEQVEAKGGKYAKSVYAAMITDKGLELVNVKFHGSALNWIEQHFREDGSIIELYNGDESSKDKKGKNEYYCPRYKRLPPDPAWTSVAVEMDKELQGYLMKYFGKVTEENLTPIDDVPPPVSEHETTDGLPF